MKTIENVSLLEILPPSISGDAKIIALCKSLQNELDLLTAQTKLPLHLPRLNELDHEVLDRLAEQFDVLFYEPDSMTVETKRQLIAQSLLSWRKIGTAYAVKKMLDTFSKDSTIQEWFEADYKNPKPYHFKLKLQRLRDLEDSGETLMRLIDAVKNVRSWIDDFDFNLTRDEKPDEILHVGFADVTAGKQHFDINSTFHDKHELRRVAFDITHGRNFYSQEFTNKKSRLQLRAGFINLQFGKIEYKTTLAADDELWYRLWLNWIKSRWKNYDPAVINFYRDEPIDDGDDDEIDEQNFEGDFVKLWISYHNDDSTRLIILKNARDDITGEDVNAVNVDGIFKNRRGYLSDKIIKAAYSKKSVYKLFF